MAPSQTQTFYAFPHADGRPPPALLAKCRIMALEHGDMSLEASSGQVVNATEMINRRNEVR